MTERQLEDVFICLKVFFACLSIYDFVWKLLFFASVIGRMVIDLKFRQEILTDSTVRSTKATGTFTHVPVDTINTSTTIVTRK